MSSIDTARMLGERIAKALHKQLCEVATERGDKYTSWDELADADREMAIEASTRCYSTGAFFNPNMVTTISNAFSFSYLDLSMCASGLYLQAQAMLESASALMDTRPVNGVSMRPGLDDDRRSTNYYLVTRARDHQRVAERIEMLRDLLYPTPDPD